MRRIFGLLMALAITTSAYSATSGSNAGIEISSSIENKQLKIEVADELSDATVTVSVFSSTGEIVLEKMLAEGLNKIDVQSLNDGDYVAVVRENGEYTSKQSFTVS